MENTFLWKAMLLAETWKVKGLGLPMVIKNGLFMENDLALLLKQVFMMIVQGTEVKIQAVSGNLHKEFGGVYFGI